MAAPLLVVALGVLALPGALAALVALLVLVALVVLEVPSEGKVVFLDGRSTTRDEAVANDLSETSLLSV